MADPIEIIQTVISVSQQIYGIVKSIKGAPDELKTIDRAVSRILPILKHLVETLGNRVQEEDRDPDAAALRSLCDEARELVEVAKGFLGSRNDGTFKLRKKEWPRWLMKKSDREDLAKRFHDLHGAISAYLSYDVHREMTVELRVIRNIHQMCSVAAIQRDVRQHQGPYNERGGPPLGYEIARCVMRSAAQSQTQEFNQHYDEVTTADAGTLVRAFMLHSDPATLPLRPCTTFHDNPCNDICSPSCRCRCHHPPIALVPQFLRPVVGSISVEHDWISALRSIRTACDERECRRHRSNLLRIKYYCPTWFAQINAEIRTERAPIHFVIQTPRIVQSLAWIDHATLDEVRQKLWSRELSVNDVEPGGFSVVHRMTLRLAFNRSDAALSILALLTEHSAPADWEYGGLTPTEHALRLLHMFSRFHGTREAAFSALKHWLGPHLPQDIEEAYEGLATKRHWTTLHRLITRPSSSAVTFIPLELISQVNIKDSSGWTPLFYAALVPPEAIHALLVVGANPRTDAPVLNNAAWAGASTAISMLVRAGAYINAFDAKKHTALHCAADPRLSNFWDGFAVALQLVRHAGHLLDWDARDNGGRTPYEFAQIEVRENPENEKSKHILKLYQTCRLPEGAQYIPTPVIVDVEDGSARDDGTNLPSTSLIRAGLRGDVDAIGDLIRRDAMVNERDDDGLTLIHLVTLGRVPNGYRVALELVRHGGWGVDWDALVAASERGTEDESEGGNEDDNGHQSESQEHDTGSEDDSGKEGKDDEKVIGTALEIAQARLDNEELTEEDREELEKIRDLLQARRLPRGEKYLWPCMDPDFYKPKPLPMPRMPGAWDDE